MGKINKRQQEDNFIKGLFFIIVGILLILSQLFPIFFLQIAEIIAYNYIYIASFFIIILGILLLIDSTLKGD
jgi:hypothetical protein